MKDGKIIPKGFLRSYILAVLLEGPAFGKEIRERIYKKSKFWKPSYGTIYPMLSQMAKEGLLSYEVKEGRKIYRLTEKGEEKAKKVLEVQKEIEKKINKVLSLALSIDERYIEEIKEKLTEEKRKQMEKCGLADSLNKSVKLLMKLINEKPEKMCECKKAVDEFNEKLKKIVND